MTALDMTNELAPLIWTIEGMMLVAVVWLVGMFFAEQVRPTSFHIAAAPDPEPSDDLPDEPASDNDRRLAA